jgi:tetratricopeptide (TPR) repeat protein
MTFQAMHARERQATNRRLNSWKEIASFFGKDERTVKRWEKQRGLPVHRVPGGEKGGVFVFTDELSDWLETRGEAGGGADQNAIERAHGSVDRQVATPSEAKLDREVALGPPHRATAARIIGGVVLVLFLASLTYKLQTRNGTTSADKSEAGAVKSRGRAANPQAEEFYLQGRYYWNKRTPDDLNRAVDYFTQAIVRDPTYAQAYAGMADCYTLLREYTAMPDKEAYPRALAAAQKAVELDDKLADAHASLGFISFYWSWDVAAAEHEFQRALDLDPNDVSAHHWYATVLSEVGREGEALTEIERARNLDPGSTSILADKGLLLFNAGQQEQAVALLKQMEATEPEFASPHRYLADIYFRTRDYAHYLVESSKAAQLMNDKQALTITTSAEKGFTKNGRQGMLEAVLKTQEKFYRESRESPYTLAVSCALLGKKQKALQYLQAAYDGHDGAFLSMSIDRALISLRNEPRYQALLARVGFRPIG